MEVRDGERFGVDHETGRIVMGRVSLPLPASRAGGMGVGGLLVADGALGFLPVLGFWMLPLGIVVLSHDLHAAWRLRRRTVVWWGRRKTG